MVGDIREIEEPISSGFEEPPTWKSIVEHIRLIDRADLSFPIILSSEGRVMDGMHRAAKALIQEVDSLPAKQFAQDPAPDHIGVQPDDLPYEK